MAAKMKIDAAKVWDAPEGALVNVGHNRVMAWAYDPKGNKVFSCFLHGSCIAVVRPHGMNGTASVRLDHCGFLSATTVKAMGEFLAAFGIEATVSRAKGELACQYTFNGTQHRRAGDMLKFSFSADRYPAKSPVLSLDETLAEV